MYDVLPFVFFFNSICWRSMKLRLKREWIYFRIWSNTFTPSASKFFFFVMSFQMYLSSWQILVDMNSMTSRNSQHSCENLQRKGWGTDTGDNVDRPRTCQMKEATHQRPHGVWVCVWKVRSKRVQRQSSVVIDGQGWGAGGSGGFLLTDTGGFGGTGNENVLELDIAGDCATSWLC